MLMRKVNHQVLPFAGITLTRFYGFDLSLLRSTPGNLPRLRRDIEN
jgi:hypothetical protein